MSVIDLTARDNQLTRDIMDCFFKVHRQMGPGLLESIYEACLCYEFSKRNIHFEKQKIIPLHYDDLIIDAGLRLDIVVEDKIIVEIKSVERTLPVHDAQLISYLRLSGLEIGFLVNFNVPLIKDGVKRLVNNHLKNSASPRLRGENFE